MTTTNVPQGAAASSQTDAPAKSRKRSAGMSILLRLCGLIVLIGGWQGAALAVNNERIFPGPGQVWAYLLELVGDGAFLHHGYLSLRRVFIGFVVAFVVAIIAGVALGRSRIFEEMFGIYVFLTLTIPGLAYAVISMIFLGLTETAAVIGVAAAIVSVMILNVWEGTKALDGKKLEMARIFELRSSTVIRDIVVPSLTPYLFAAGRLGLSQAWKLVVLVELLGLSDGVGYGISRSFNNFQMVGVLAWTLGFSIVMAAIEFGIFRPIERHVLRWRPQLPQGGRRQWA